MEKSSLERRKKKQHQHSNDQNRRCRSPKLSVALDLVNKPNSSPTRVDGIRSLLSRKFTNEINLSLFSFFMRSRRNLFLT